MKKLYRSRTNKAIAGVLGGLGEYTNIDPVVLRLLFVCLVIFTGFFPGILLYVLAALIIPEQAV